MPHYLIQGGDDGTTIRPLVGVQLAYLLTNPEDWGVKKFFIPTDWDANYWPDGAACLIKGEVVIPPDRSQPR